MGMVPVKPPRVPLRERMDVLPGFEPAPDPDPRDFGLTWADLNGRSPPSPPRSGGVASAAGGATYWAALLHMAVGTLVIAAQLGTLSIWTVLCVVLILAWHVDWGLVVLDWCEGVAGRRLLPDELSPTRRGYRINERPTTPKPDVVPPAQGPRPKPHGSVALPPKPAPLTVVIRGRSIRK